ncbi:MAG: hypothetical protein MJ168_04305 [Clostridia bacterium]|nr:hypothetical protein [Clostridia bacterium]
MRKTKILKKATSFVLAVIMVLSCMTAGLSVIAMASDWVYIAGQSGRVARTLYIKADQLWNGYTGLIGGSNYIIDENGNSKAVTVGQSGGATKYYTSADGNDTWWAWTNYVLADAEIEHCAVTRTNNNTLYNSYSGKYIVNNGSSITSSTGSSAWTFANNQIYCSSGYMYENSNGIALRSSSSQIYAYTNPTPSMLMLNHQADITDMPVPILMSLQQVRTLPSMM